MPKVKKVHVNRERAILSRLRAKFGAHAATTPAEAAASAEMTEYIPTGIDVLDRYVLARGGLPVGRYSEVYGENSCLVGSTHIAYQVHRQGRLINSKGGSIENLYRRLHGVQHHLASNRVRYSAPSIDSSQRVIHNEIVDVVDSGVQECFRLTTDQGFTITTTLDHEFYTGGGLYRALADLEEGDQVYVDLSTRVYATTNRRVYLFVKHHPVAGEKIVRAKAKRTSPVYKNYRYRRLARSRAVVEAAMNGLSLQAYVARLNVGKLRGLKFLPREMHVHHLDADTRNDVPDNLVVVRGKDHSRLHALAGSTRRYIAADAIKEIVAVGKHRTYDVRMADPFRNLIANGVVVHNCGKTSLGYACEAGVQRAGGVAVHVDIEQSFDEERAQVFGVDTESLIVVEAENAEQSIEQLKETLDAHDPDEGPLVIVYDSIAATKTKNAMGAVAGEKQPAREAALFSEELPKLLTRLKRKRAHIMFLNQIRTKFGVMFGDNTTTPGGNAPKFYASVRLAFYGGKALKNAKDEHVGKVVTIMAAKNRLAAPFRKARVRLDFASGWNNVYSTLKHAKRMGVIEPREKGFRGKGKESLEAYIEACKRLEWPCDEARAKATLAHVKGSVQVEDDD